MPAVYYVRKPNSKVIPQLNFQLYSGAGSDVPHCFRRKGPGGASSSASPVSSPRFLGDGCLQLLKEWPKKGVLDKPGGSTEGGGSPHAGLLMPASL